MLLCRLEVQQEQLRRLAAAEEAADGQGAGEQPPDDDREHTCAVCMDRQPNTVFPACGHMCVCVRCAIGLTSCPICRRRSSAIRIYRT